jgi:cellulose synthase/poly-beta-1,6-N-acetylglucosamine synthase-like glycosyltransferase
MTAWLSTTIGVGLVAMTFPLIAELALVTGAGFLPRRKSASVAGTRMPRLAVVIPAHNEELLVGRSVASVLASAHDDVDIYVVAHNSTDQTALRAKEAGAEVLVYDDPAAVGKGFALRYGFEHALAKGADALLVIDADSRVSSTLIAQVRNAFAEGAEVVQCRYEMESVNGKTKARIRALAVRAMNVVRLRGRERLGLSAGIVGNGFAVSRRVLEEVPYHAFSVVEDLEYHIHLVSAGERVRFLEDALVLTELPNSAAGEQAQHSRWDGGRLAVARQSFLPLTVQVLRGKTSLTWQGCR